MLASSPNRKLQKERGSNLDTLFKISAFFVSIAWFFFLLGWLYLAEVYGSFGVVSNINILDFPFYYSAINSIIPISIFIKPLTWAFAVGLLLTMLWVFEHTITALFQKFVWIRWILALSAFLILLIQVWIIWALLWRFRWVLGAITLLLMIAWRLGWLKRLRNGVKMANQQDAFWGERRKQIKHWIFRTLWSLPVLVLFLSATQTAILKGQKDGKDWHENPLKHTKPVCLSFKKEERQLFDPELVTANSSGKLMLLAQTKELVLVFAIDGYGKTKRGVFIIPIANLQSVYNDNSCANLSKVVVNPPATPQKPKLKRQHRRACVSCEA